MKEYFLYPISKINDIVFKKWLPQGLPVLLYHSIGDRDSNITVKAERFGQQMKYLYNSGYKTIHPRDLPDLKNFDKKIIITFDDGWNDNLTAAPILAKYGFNPVLFIVAGYIGENGTFAKNTADKSATMLSEKEISRLEDLGWLIANHFASHRDLDRLSAGEIREEYEGNKTKLAKIIRDKSNLDIVSYPHNLISDEVIEAVKSCGAIMGFGGQRRFYYPGDNLLKIPRIEIFPDTSFFQFKLLLSQTYDYAKRNFIK